MARRKSAIEQAREKGPILVVDAGNALFKTVGPPDATERKRAALILQAMGSAGTAAMAAGSRDLAGGVSYLLKAARTAAVPVLSANIVGPDGKRVFPASTIISVANSRVALVGLSPSGPVAGSAGYQGVPGPRSVLEEIARLGDGIDVVIVLAAVPPAEAAALANEAGSRVDFILQSYEPGGLGVQRGNGNFVVSTGERGRQVGRMIVSPSGARPFQDRSDEEQAQKLVAFLDGQIAEARARIEATTDPKSKRDLQGALASLEARRTEASRDAKSKGTNSRSFSIDSLLLGPDLPDDPAIRAQVIQLEPAPKPN